MQISDRFKIITAAGILLASLIPAGCAPQNAESGPPQDRTPEVAVVTIRPQQVMLSTELPGRTSAYLVAEIRPQVNGIIQKRLFREGDDVKAGDLLYQIDSAPFQSAYSNQKAALGKAEASLVAIRLRAERYKKLLFDKAVSQQDYDDAAAALQQAKAEVAYWKAAAETARINLGYTRVTAPISGRIGKSNVTVGALVTAYQPNALATIQQFDPIYADVPQSTIELLRLKNSGLNRDGTNQNKVKLILEDGTAYPLEGTLQFSDISVDPTTGSVILRVVFPNPEGVLLPGMFIRTVIKEGVDKQAILIPQQAVSRDHKGNPMALIVDAENKTALRMLTVDRAVGNQWLVSSGLAPGDRVIVEGLKMLRPGAVVKASPFNAKGKKNTHGPQPTGESK